MHAKWKRSSESLSVVFLIQDSCMESMKYKHAGSGIFCKDEGTAISTFYYFTRMSDAFSTVLEET